MLFSPFWKILNIRIMTCNSNYVKPHVCYAGMGQTIGWLGWLIFKMDKNLWSPGSVMPWPIPMCTCKEVKKHLPDLPLAQGQFAPRVYHHLQALRHRLGVWVIRAGIPWGIGDEASKMRIDWWYIWDEWLMIIKTLGFNII